MSIIYPPVDESHDVQTIQIDCWIRDRKDRQLSLEMYQTKLNQNKNVLKVCCSKVYFNSQNLEDCIFYNLSKKNLVKIQQPKNVQAYT